MQSLHSMRGRPSGQNEELETVGELSKVCSQIVLKCLCLARKGRPDVLWSVNKLKWTRACGKRLARLISHIHHTSDHRQYCHVGNTAQHCRLGLFQDSDFAGDFEDSESTSKVIRCIFGSRTFVPMSWMCRNKRQSLTVQRNLKLFLWTLVFAWTVSPLSISGIWLFEVLHSSKTHQYGETRGETKPKGNTPRRRNSSTEMMLNYSMWITLSHTPSTRRLVV